MLIPYTIYKNSKSATALSVTGSMFMVAGISVGGVSVSEKDDMIPMLAAGLLLAVLGGLMLFGAAKLHERQMKNSTKGALGDPILKKHITDSALAAYSLYLSNPSPAMVQFIGPLNPFAASRILDMAANKITEEQAIELMRRYDSIETPGQAPKLPWEHYTNGYITLNPIRSPAEIRKEKEQAIAKIKRKDNNFRVAIIVMACLALLMVPFGFVLNMFPVTKTPQPYNSKAGTYCAVDVVAIEDSSIFTTYSDPEVYKFKGANGEEGDILLTQAMLNDPRVQCLLAEDPQGAVTMYGTVSRENVNFSFGGGAITISAWNAGLEPETAQMGGSLWVVAGMLLFVTGIVWAFKYDNKKKLRAYQI